MTTKKIGLIAGEGKMPVYIAQKAVAKGYEVVVAGVKGNATPGDYPDVHVFKVFRLGQLGATIEYFKNNGVTRVIMAGRVQHTSIFSNIVPDLRGAKFLTTLKTMQPKDILSRVINEFKKDGIEFASSASFLEDFLPQKGVLSTRQPTAEEQKVIEFGFQTAKKIAGMDIGLTCVVSQQAVIAVEGMEGTDRCILRAGELVRESAEKKNTVAVVKVARPNQDNRYDLPVIGKGTLESMIKAGFTVLAFEAGETLVMDLEEVVKLADKHKICLCAV